MRNHLGHPPFLFWSVAVASAAVLLGSSIAGAPEPGRMGVPAPSYEDVASDLRSLAASPPSSTDAGAFDAWLVAVSENVLLLSEVSEEGGASPRGEIGELSALLEEALLEESMTAAERSRTVSEVVRILYIILSR